MKAMALLLSGLLLSAVADAGDVYVTTDAQGHPVYTDTPQAVPAQKVDVRVSNPEPTAAVPGTSPPAKQSVQQSTSAPSQQMTAQQAAQATAEDRAKRCTDARQRYQGLMESWRIYEPGPDGERTYLTSEQIDAARANAKKVMDEFCAGQ